MKWSRVTYNDVAYYVTFVTHLIDTSLTEFTISINGDFLLVVDRVCFPQTFSFSLSDSFRS